MNSHCLMECARLVISLPFQYDMIYQILIFRTIFRSLGISLTERYPSLKDSFGMTLTGSLEAFGLNRGLMQSDM